MQPGGDIRAQLEAKAFELGFDQFGITEASTSDTVIEGFRNFIKMGRHASLDWLAERMPQREHPKGLWPEARSVIMLAESYTPEEDPMAVVGCPDRGAISVYARNKDYHDLVKKRLKRLARWLIAEGGGEVQVVVDVVCGGGQFARVFVIGQAALDLAGIGLVHGRVAGPGGEGFC